MLVYLIMEIDNYGDPSESIHKAFLIKDEAKAYLESMDDVEDWFNYYLKELEVC